MRVLSKEQIRATLTVARAHSERDYLMILVTFLHGIRASETVAMTAGSIQDGYLTVKRGKGSKITRQPLLSSADPLFDERTALLKWIENMPVQQRIFPLHRVTFWRIVQRHGKAAGVPAHLCHPHAEKHCCGRTLIKKHSLPEVQKWLGHASIKSTGIYTEADETEVNDTILSSAALV